MSNSMKWKLCGLIGMIALLLAACGPIGAPKADIVIGDTGCDTATLLVAADHEPRLLVRNTGAEPMVISVPTLNNSVSVPPGQQGELQLQQMFWGETAYYCLTERDHTAAGGAAMAAGFVCGLDSYALRSVARSSGLLTVERSNRVDTLPTLMPDA
jgi:hypothetical protein